MNLSVVLEDLAFGGRVTLNREKPRFDPDTERVPFKKCPG